MVFVLAGISISRLVGARFVHVLTGLGAMTAVTMLIFQDTILSFVASVRSAATAACAWATGSRCQPERRRRRHRHRLHTVTVRNWDHTVTTVPTKLISESFRNWRPWPRAAAAASSVRCSSTSTACASSNDEVARFRLLLLDDYLDGKEAELRDWNAKLAEHGASR